MDINLRSACQPCGPVLDTSWSSQLAKYPEKWGICGYTLGAQVRWDGCGAFCILIGIPTGLCQWVGCGPAELLCLCFGLTPGWEGGCCGGWVYVARGDRGFPVGHCRATCFSPDKEIYSLGGGNLHHCDRKVLATESLLQHIQPQENKWEHSLC